MSNNGNNNNTEKYWAGFAENSEQISWNRFANFLTFNSILILGWATLYAVWFTNPENEKHPDVARGVMVSLSLVGLVSCLVWSVLGFRGRRHHSAYLHEGKEASMRQDTPSSTDNRQKSFSELSEDLREKNFPAFGSFYIHVLTPVVVSALYVVLLDAVLSSGASPPLLLYSGIAIGFFGEVFGWVFWQMYLSWKENKKQSNRTPASRATYLRIVRVTSVIALVLFVCKLANKLCNLPVQEWWGLARSYMCAVFYPVFLLWRIDSYFLLGMIVGTVIGAFIVHVAQWSRVIDR